MAPIEAVYEGGVFRPLEPVELPDQQRVTLTVSEQPADGVRFDLPPDRWQAFCDALDAPPRVIPALRKLFTDEGVFDGPRAT